MKLRLPLPDQALPGRDAEMPVPDRHYVNGHPLKPPFPEGVTGSMTFGRCRSKKGTDARLADVARPSTSGTVATLTHVLATTGSRNLRVLFVLLMRRASSRLIVVKTDAWVSSQT